MSRKGIDFLIGFFLVIILTTNLLAVPAPFIDDMESSAPGWVWTSTNDWERGEPTGGGGSRPTFPTPPPLVHPSRTNCWGTILGGNGKYSKNTTSVLTSPQIDFISAPNPFLSYYAWYAMAAGDYATSEVSTNGTTWNVLETIVQNSSSGGWLKKTYDLSGYTGTNYTGNIWVRFTLSADNDNNRDLGLYIDDVAVGTNYDTQNRYIMAIEPEPIPISTATASNNMTVRVEVRDLFRYIDNATNEVTIQSVEGNPNNSLTQVTSPPVYLSGGRATFTFTDDEKESI